jgi:hypothetical protein
MNIVKINPEKETENDDYQKVGLHKKHRIKQMMKNGYGCLCISLNEKVQKVLCLKLLTSTLFGFPLHTWIFVMTIFLVGVGALAWLCIQKSAILITNNSYFANCTSNTGCDTLIGLSCATQDDTCNCPAKKTKGRCDCSSGYYWNGITCTILLQYNKTGCNYDYNCDQSKRLKCSNNICSCVSPRTWDSTLQACTYKLSASGSLWLNLQTIFKSTTGLRTYYFVDACIDLCFKLNNKYSYINVMNNLNNCACSNTNHIFFSNVQCDALCYSSDNRAYSCGFINQNNNYYAQYVNF